MEAIKDIERLLAKVIKKEDAIINSTKELAVRQLALDKVILEQDLTSRSLQALQNVRPIIAAISSEQAIALANQALAHVFLSEDRLFFSEEDARFFISTPNGDTDLVEANGGGYLSIVSFIFTLFLLITSKARRFLLYDEQFTMISDEALIRFIPFLTALCKDLELDILFITHDARININDVDKLYLVDNGYIKKLK